LNTKLNKDSSEPLYIQLSDTIEYNINTGIYPPGSKIPSEQDLMEVYKVSRVTVRKATQYLTTKGLIVRKQGMGTFVNKPVISQSIDDLTCIFPSLLTKGVSPKLAILEYQLIYPNKEAQTNLQISKDELVLKFTRRFSANKTVLAIAEMYIPNEIAKHWSQEEASIKTLFWLLQKNVGIKLGSSQVKVRAALATKKIADWLQVPKRSPILELRRLTYSDEQKPLEYTLLSFRGESYELTTKVISGGLVLMEQNQPFSQD